MARSRSSKFDASDAITNELIRIIERGVLPWRRPWIAGVSSRLLRENGEAYKGINNFLRTMRTQLSGYASPFWMTLRQANQLDAKISIGERSSLVVYYGQAYKKDVDANEEGERHRWRAKLPVPKGLPGLQR